MASQGTISWEELISELEDEFSGSSVDIDRVKHVMQSYRSCEGDWKQFAKFDRYRLDCFYHWFQYLYNLYRVWLTEGIKSHYILVHASGREARQACSSVYVRYTRNLVNEGNEKFNLIILCWSEGQGRYREICCICQPL